MTVDDGPDGTSVLTMQFQVGSAPMIEPCAVLVKPRAQTRLLVRATPAAMLLQIDNTKGGSNYRLLPARPGKGARCR